MRKKPKSPQIDVTAYRVEIGKFLSELRKQKGMTKYAVTQRSGVQNDQLAFVEDGSRMYTIDTLLRVCIALDCEISLEEGKPKSLIKHKDSKV